jgi:hypothetical protein
MTRFGTVGYDLGTVGRWSRFDLGRSMVWPSWSWLPSSRCSRFSKGVAILRPAIVNPVAFPHPLNQQSFGA